MAVSKSVNEWRKFVQSSLDFRPDDGVYRVSRRMFTEPELFDLEMELVGPEIFISHSDCA